MDYKTRLATSQGLLEQIKILKKDSRKYEKRSDQMKRASWTVDEKIDELRRQRIRLKYSDKWISSWSQRGVSIESIISESKDLAKNLEELKVFDRVSKRDEGEVLEKMEYLMDRFKKFRRQLR